MFAFSNKSLEKDNMSFYVSLKRLCLKNLKYFHVYGLIHYLYHFEIFRKGGNIIPCHENKLTPAGWESVPIKASWLLHEPLLAFLKIGDGKKWSKPRVDCGWNSYQPSLHGALPPPPTFSHPHSEVSVLQMRKVKQRRIVQHPLKIKGGCRDLPMMPCSCFRWLFLYNYLLVKAQVEKLEKKKTL